MKVINEIEGYRGRKIFLNNRYRVYQNLNNGLFSIMAIGGEHKGLVVGHLDSLRLQNVEVLISKSGQKRAINSGVRTVHAYVVGTLTEAHVNPSEAIAKKLRRISYNPFKNENFIYADNPHVAFSGCNEALFINKRFFERTRYELET